MSVDIIHSEDPYELDYISVEWKNKIKRIPALTVKNAKFISAVVKLDSNYGKDSDVNFLPDSNYVPGSKDNGTAKGGSSAYWFNKILTDKINYETNLLGAIICVDVINSTHLEASNEGRQTLKRRIMQLASNSKNLKKNKSVI